MDIEQNTKDIMVELQLNNVCNLLGGTMHRKLVVDYTGHSHREIVITYDQKEKSDEPK